MLRIISTKLNHQLISAVTEDFKIQEFCVTDENEAADKFNIGDIVVGRITNIVKNINSIFVKIHPEIEGYLNYEAEMELIYANGKTEGKPVVSDLILVQIAKEPTKTKSYTLTSTFTFMNKYVVLKPDIKKVLFSSKLKGREEYKKMREFFLEIGDDFFNKTNVGFIVRSSALALEEKKGKFEEALEELYETYCTTIKRGKHGVQYEKIYCALPPHLCLIRDHHEEIEKVMTDDEKTYEEYYNYLEKSNDLPLSKLFFYQDEKMSLANLYSIRSTLENCLSKRVWLKSGAYLIIEYTEALTVIDVNSGKAVSGKSGKKETFLNINLEAAEEIVKQMKLRNLSGMILIDFIDRPEAQNKTLMKAMNTYLKDASLNANVVDMTKLGLMELTKRRTGKPLHEFFRATQI